MLHAVELAVTRASLRARRSGAGRDRGARPQPESETLALALRHPVGPGEVSLELAWTGRFCEGLRGLYPAGGGMAATQFEAADARRVFPCLDEPGFKAPWRLTVELPAGATLLANAAVEAEEPRGGTRRVVVPRDAAAADLPGCARRRARSSGCAS